MTLYVLCALLCGALVAGPALANPGPRLAQAPAQPNDDDDDTPAPPPPPPPPPPAPVQPAPPAPPPAGGVYYGQPYYGQPVPGYGYGYGYGPAPRLQLSPAELYASGSRLRNVGLPLTISGIVLFIVGIGLLVKSADSAGHCAIGDYSCDESGQYLAWGLVSFLGSVVGLGVGIPLWAVGSSRVRRAAKMGFAPAYAQPFVAPTSNGAVAGLRLAAF